MNDQLKEAIAQFQSVEKLRSLVGNALTRQQQLAISVKMQKNQEAFAQFANSDDGRAALRHLAETFINFDKE
jgi:hypothetical protein